MSFKKKLSAVLMSLALVTGTAVAGAAPANAGTSIGATYNGASHVYYKFYASTNTFCIKKKYDKSYTASVGFYSNGKFIVSIGTDRFDQWYCKDLDKYGSFEGKTLKFKLQMWHKSKSVFRASNGYVFV